MTRNGTITVIDYGMGNVGSVANMVRHCGGVANLTADPDAVTEATKLILPGVGSFDAGMRALRQRGLDSAIRAAVRERGATLLGICLGMQLLVEQSEEGTEPGLGLIRGSCVRLAGEGVRVPHMGWAAVRPVRSSTLFDATPDERRFYFVHSYHVACASSGDVAAVAEYGESFTAALERDRVMGVQFHPEKSHRFGMGLFRRILGN